MKPNNLPAEDSNNTPVDLPKKDPEVSKPTDPEVADTSEPVTGQPKVYTPGEDYEPNGKDSPDDVAPKVIDGDFSEVHDGQSDNEVAAGSKDTDHDGIDRDGVPDGEDADEGQRKEIDPTGKNEPGHDGDIDTPDDKPEKPDEPEKKHESLLVSAIKGGLAGAGLGGLNSAFHDHDEAINKENHDNRIDYNEKMADYKKGQAEEQADHERDYADIKQEREQRAAENGKHSMNSLGYQGNKASEQTARDFQVGKEQADAQNAKRDGMFGMKRNFYDKVDQIRGIKPNDYTINTSDGSKFAYNPQERSGGDHLMGNGNYAKTKNNGYTGSSHLK